MLNVVAALKNKYPDVHYIIQGSENKLNMEEHDELYNKIIDQCKYLGITENVTVNRGFVSEEVLMSAIRTVKVCVLPYNIFFQFQIIIIIHINMNSCHFTFPLIFRNNKVTFNF